ncbi:trigger factor [Lapidilactobacillus dextrinicus DSM 20335]|uniref:Trigger factor n=1 Tax=Lapidilactobacillus dextrinicus DSM 20335 TaxID=1423738 RepID=A0A0R2BTW4_9LACO|nr:trigger factor [Lapidilactobacillus dextrinicus]KRM79148.1 trigger factor [Lapidilactobacillus dextrinicus DSM 20335]QFG47005.1 trigger factor [Lapidilactobacillus dextrinicus]
MSAKWEKKGTNDGELTFEISINKINEGLDAAFARVKKNLSVPGFRKGKVSRQVFNKMYGEASLYEDALNIVLPDVYEAAIDEAGIEPVDQPEISVEKMDPNEPWVLKAKVTVKPEVVLGEYKGLTVPKQNTEVTDADVDAELEKRREQQAELVLKEDGVSEKGDTVTIDYKGTVDGEAFDGGAAENHSIGIGSNTFIPGFEDQLIGHKAGDEFDVVVTFPEDYQAKELAGKEATFATTMHEVKTKELPELDDDFAKDIDEEVETLIELKAKTKEQLEKSKKEEAEAAVQNAAIDKAVANAEIKELPQAMIESEVHNQMDQYLGNMQRQGIDPKMYYQLTGTTEEDLHKQFENDADQRVRTDLVLNAIVKAEDIEPSQEEIDHEIDTLAADYNMEKDAVRQALTDDMLKHDIGIKKAIDIITDSAVQE